MSPRRAALVVTILLGVTGAITYLRPPLRPAAPSAVPAVVERPPTKPAAPAPDEEPRLALDVADPTELMLSTASRAVLAVKVPEAGDVEIDDLGLIMSAAPNAPAIFDLFLNRPGEHGVFFRPAGGKRRVAGSLVVR